MTSAIREKTLHSLFLISVWLKGGAGMLETLAGVPFSLLLRELLRTSLFYSRRRNCLKIPTIGLPLPSAVPFITFLRIPGYL
jgi:hypothetical protein